MRVQTSLMSFLAAGTVMALALAAGVAAPTLRFADKGANAIPVDTELVIAVDVSNSMDPEEQELQREGYITGLTSREFMSAVRGGTHGKVAVTYFEWAGLYDQKIVMPWRMIDGPESADAVANEIARAPYRRAPRTSIFGALQFAKPLFDSSGYNGLRRVIDVSGDGVNNMGPPVTLMRDDVLGSGITINGCRSCSSGRSATACGRCSSRISTSITRTASSAGRARSSFRSRSGRSSRKRRATSWCSRSPAAHLSGA